MILFGPRKGIQVAAAIDVQLQRLSGLIIDMQLVRDGALPETLVSGDAPILDQWILAQRLVPCLAGLSTGHPTLPGENRPIGTSEV